MGKEEGQRRVLRTLKVNEGGRRWGRSKKRVEERRKMVRRKGRHEKVRRRRCKVRGTKHRGRQAPVRCTASTTTCFQGRLGPLNKTSQVNCHNAVETPSTAREHHVDHHPSFNDTFRCGGCLRRDDESPETFPSHVHRLPSPSGPSPERVVRRLVALSSLSAPQWKRLASFSVAIKADHARPSNDTEVTDCPLLVDEKNASTGNAKETEGVKTGTTWPAPRVSPRPVKAGPRGHDAGASGARSTSQRQCKERRFVGSPPPPGTSHSQFDTPPNDSDQCNNQVPCNTPPERVVSNRYR